MPDKGPRVFLDYDQAALDAAYDQAVYAANREQLIKRRVRDTELTRRRIGEPERVAYGPAAIVSCVERCLIVVEEDPRTFIRHRTLS